MEKINKEFDIPYYIFEEIVKYVELSSKEKCKNIKWNNIEILLQLAIKNNRLTKEQVDFLKEKYYKKTS